MKVTSQRVRAVLRSLGYVMGHNRARQAIRVPNRPKHATHVSIWVDFDSDNEKARTMKDIQEQLMELGFNVQHRGGYLTVEDGAIND